MNSKSVDFMEKMRAEHEIRTVLGLYCRGVDRRDFGLVRSVYHEDANDYHGSYNGGVEGLIKWMIDRHRHVEQSMHFIGNCHIEWLDENTTLVETYCVTYQRVSPDGIESLKSLGFDANLDSRQTQVRCRYVDLFERRNGEWRIAERTVVYESMIFEKATGEDAFGDDFEVAKRNKQDKIYNYS